MLDFKIKELKQQIGPKEIEIKKLKEQVNKMRTEYKHFTRVNQNLALIVEDLRLRQEGLTKEVKTMRNKLAQQDAIMKRFKDDLSDELLSASTDKLLKKGIINLHKKWVLSEQSETRIVKDSAIDLQQQSRRHFEDGITQMRSKMKTQNKNFKKKNERILNDNVQLIDEINRLKMEAHLLN